MVLLLLGFGGATWSLVHNGPRIGEEGQERLMRSPAAVFLMVGGFVAFLLVAMIAVVDLDRAGVRGILIGSGLGLLNLALGYPMMRRTLKRGIRTAVGTVAGGMTVRMAVVVLVMVLLQRSGLADPAAFALTFLIFFFVYLAFEVLDGAAVDGSIAQCSHWGRTAG